MKSGEYERPPLVDEDFTPNLPVSYALVRYHHDVRVGEQMRQMVASVLSHLNEQDLEQEATKPGTNIRQFYPRRDPDPAA